MTESESIDGDSFFRQITAANNVLYPATEIRLPVYDGLVSAIAGSDVCSRVPLSLSGEVFTTEDLTLTPFLEGAILTVPYLRIFDGTLISAQFRVLILDEISLELVSYEFLNAALSPGLPSNFNAAGRLEIRELTVEGAVYDLTLMHVTNSDPVTFGDLEVFQHQPLFG